jgi:hypothetical protein
MLLYELPAFYERREISAKKVEFGVEVYIPLCSDESDDVMLVKVE